VHIFLALFPSDKHRLVMECLRCPNLDALTTSYFLHTTYSNQFTNNSMNNAGNLMGEDAFMDALNHAKTFLLVNHTFTVLVPVVNPPDETMSDLTASSNVNTTSVMTILNRTTQALDRIGELPAPSNENMSYTLQSIVQSEIMDDVHASSIGAGRYHHNAHWSLQWFDILYASYTFYQSLYLL
jgi:hypothetical protein